MKKTEEKNVNMQAVREAMLAMTRQCWEQGITAQALLETEDWDRLKIVVHDMVIRQSEDGRLCNVENTPAVTDSAFCIPAAYLLGKRLHKEDYVAAAERNISFLLEKAAAAEDGTLFHMKGTGEVWADSAAYLPYALALTGHEKEGWQQMKGITSRLYDPESGLYYHMWDENSGKYLRPLCWGVGNGWILTGLLRLIAVCRETSENSGADVGEMRRMFHDLLDRMLELETPEHGFHDILDDEQTFQETETAAMVAYAIYRGIREGEVSREYKERADNIRQYVLAKISPEGLVWDAASSPSFDHPGTAVECQAHVLIMEKEYKRVECSNF